MDIFIEALFVGFAIATIGLVISTLFMYLENSTFSLKKWTFWKSVLFSYFFTGFIGHLIFQYTGMNSYYCKYGVACKR